MHWSTISAFGLVWNRSQKSQNYVLKWIKIKESFENRSCEPTKINDFTFDYFKRTLKLTCHASSRNKPISEVFQIVINDDK